MSCSNTNGIHIPQNGCTANLKQSAHGWLATSINFASCNSLRWRKLEQWEDDSTGCEGNPQKYPRELNLVELRAINGEVICLPMVVDANSHLHRRKGLELLHKLREENTLVSVLAKELQSSAPPLLSIILFL